MTSVSLLNDPYNLIITGVGGQGNVLASRMVGDMLSRLGFQVTIGEIFGASQRGGSVMSHLRISATWTLSPQIPKRMAHAVVALEPTEAIRVLKDYGNPHVKVLCNMRPVHAVGVICGEQRYPEPEQLKKWIQALSERAWFIDATDKAMELGSPVFANVISVGALAATGVLPLDRESFESVLSRKMSPDKMAVNLAAFDAGVAMVKEEGKRQVTRLARFTSSGSGNRRRIESPLPSVSPFESLVNARQVFGFFPDPRGGQKIVPPRIRDHSLDDDAGGDGFQEVHQQVHIDLPFHARVGPTLMERGKRGAPGDVEHVKFHPLNGQPGKEPGRPEHHLPVFSGESQDDVGADIQARLAGHVDGPREARHVVTSPDCPERNIVCGLQAIFDPYQVGLFVGGQQRQFFLVHTVGPRSH